MAEPLWSVVIPCSDKGHLVEKTIASIPESDKFEILLILSGASRDTEDRVLRLASARPLRVIQAQKPGVAHARNLGLTEARGEFVTLLDADILVPPLFFEHRLNLFRRHREETVLVSLVDGYDVGESNDYRHELLQEITPGLAKFKSEYPWMHANTAAVSFHRSQVMDAPVLFDEAFQGWGGEDQEWFLRLPEQSRLRVDSDQRVEHQPHPREIRGQVESYRRNLRYFLRKHPFPIVEALAVFGCRYAESSLARLQGVTRVHGGFGRLISEDGTEHPLGGEERFTGLFLPDEDCRYVRAEVEAQAVTQLPGRLRELLREDLSRVARHVDWPELPPAQDRVEKAWAEALSEFLFV